MMSYKKLSICTFFYLIFALVCNCFASDEMEVKYSTKLSNDQNLMSFPKDNEVIGFSGDGDAVKLNNYSAFDMSNKSEQSCKDSSNGSTQEEKFVCARMGVIDFKLISDNALAIQKMLNMTNTLNNKIQKQMFVKEREIRSIEKELISKKGIIPEEEFKKQTQEFEKKLIEIEKNVRSKKEILELRRMEVVKQVDEMINIIVNEIRAKYDLKIIFPSNQLAMFVPEINITDEVITILNERLPLVDVDLDDIIDEDEEER